MRSDSVRTSLDLPRELHRRLHELAARKGCSVRQLILSTIERTLQEQTSRRPQRRLSLETPIVPSRGKPFDLSNEELHALIESP